MTRDPRLETLLDDLIVNIGNILDISDIVAKISQIAPDHVKGDIGPAVADVGFIVRGNAANVHADFGRV